MQHAHVEEMLGCPRIFGLACLLVEGQAYTGGDIERLCAILNFEAFLHIIQKIKR